MDKRGVVSIYLLIFSLVIATLVFLTFLHNARANKNGEKLLQTYEAIDLALLLDGIESVPGEVKYTYFKQPGVGYKIDEQHVTIQKDILVPYPLGRSKDSEVHVEVAGDTLLLTKGESHE